jgi:hypothetical protein
MQVHEERSASLLGAFALTTRYARKKAGSGHIPDIAYFSRPSFDKDQLKGRKMSATSRCSCVSFKGKPHEPATPSTARVWRNKAVWKHFQVGQQVQYCPTSHRLPLLSL